LGNYTHFDFKPGNTLIFSNLVIKLTDFGFLRDPNKIKDNLNKIRIPGFTDGYIPPECFYNENHLISAEEAIKLDYFALGATIYFLKYGETMMVYPNYKNDNSKADYMIKLIEKAIDKIQTTKLNDKDFNELLINLIHYKPEDRLSFEDIYRNKCYIEYYSKEHDSITKRVIRPYELIVLDNEWGVAAFCENKQEIRHFYLNRISKLEILDGIY
jgi:serine/threonine protein kinase